MVAGYSSILRVGQAYPGLKILEFASVDETITAVVTHRADLLFGSLSTLTYGLKQQSITNIYPILQLKDGKLKDMRIASGKHMPQLAKILSKALENMQYLPMKWSQRPNSWLGW